MTQASTLATEPMTARPPLITRTALDQWHAQHGARFVEWDGWRIPAAYVDVQQEIDAARSGVGLADISAFAKVRILGRAASDAIDRLTNSKVASKPGYVLAIEGNEPVTVCHLASDHILILAATTASSMVRETLASVCDGLAVEQQDVTYGLAGFHLIGPKVNLLLRRLVGLDVSESSFPGGSCAETSCAGIHATIIREAPSEGCRVRLYVSWDFAECLWERLLEAGGRLGVMPVGMEAWRVLAGGRGG